MPLDTAATTAALRRATHLRVVGDGSSVMDGRIRAIACQPLFGCRYCEPERAKHPPPSGDSPLTQPFACSHIIFERCAVCGGNGALRSESAGSRTARDAFRADERGHCGLILILRHDWHPSRQTTGKKGNMSRPACGWEQGHSHASRYWVSNLPCQAVARRADIRSFRLL